MRINRFLEAELNEAIEGFFQKKDKADVFLNNRFKLKRLGKRDREWVRDRFYFYIRHKFLFEELKRIDGSKAKTVAMIFDNEPDDELSTQISALKNNGLYDRLFNQSFSEFLVEKIRDQFGESAFEWFNSKAETVIRTNLRKISRKDLIGKLEKEGYVLEITPISPAGIIIKSACSNLKNSQVFDDGFFEFQDESSQLTTLLVNRKTATFFDSCAGGGGKSLAAGTFFYGIKITASDIRTHLFDEISSRSKRAGIKIITKNTSEISKLMVDTVFVDAPCSGSGVLRRNPADRWIIGQNIIKELQNTQKKILKDHSRHVKPGGELIYVTCSFLKEENEQIVEEFLNKNKEFSIVPAIERMHENIPEFSDLKQVTQGDYFRISPNFSRDLMFGAILRKN